MALALDCETTGLNLHTNARPFIVSVCYDDGRHRTWVWEVDPLTRQPAVLPEDVQQIRAILDMAEGWGRDFNEETALNHCVIGHNIKFDYTALATVGVDNPAWSNTYDTTLMSHLLDSSQHHNLTDLIARYLKVDITPYEDATEAATKECRRLVQQARLAVGRGKVTDTTDMATWKIAGEGDGEGGKDWKADMWLPRAVAKYRWEVKKLPEYDPSGGYKKRHPWWDVTQIYGDVDTAGTVKLFPVLKAAVEKRGHWAIYREVNRQVRATFEMERRGVTCSGKRLHAMIAEYTAKAAEYHKGLGGIAASMGYPLEVGPTGNRTDSLHQFLFGKFGEKEVPVHDKDGHLAGVKVVPDKMTNVPGPDTLNLPVIAKTETGAPAFDKNTMDVYFATLPANSKQSIFVRRLSWLKKLSTAVSYMENYLGYAVPMEGDDDFLLLHPSIKLTATAHLRTGSERPNGQSIGKKEYECPACDGEKPDVLTCPRCKGTGVAIRSFRYAFGPEPGREWYSMDYSNIERRTVAKKAGEEEVMALLENPTAPPYYGSEHLMTAHTIHKKLFEEVCWDATNKVLDGRLFKAKFKDSHYQTTKNMVFALQYSCGREKADATAKVPGAYDMMKARFHRQEAFNQKQLDQARRFGFVVTEPDRTVDPLHGYPIRITPERDGRIKPTKPLAYWSSGTACWIARSALTRCRERLQEWRDADGFDAQIVLFPHDELVFSFPKAGHPNKDRDRSNYTRVMELKEIMQDGGPRLVMNLNSPVNVEYHDVSWDRGDAVRG